MKRLTLIWAALLPFVVVPLIVAANAPREEESVRRLLSDYEKACEQLDLKAISGLFCEDEDVVVINAAQSKRLVGHKKIVASYEDTFKNTDKVDIRHGDVKIKVLKSGDAACLSCTQHIRIVYGGNEFRLENIRMTLFLEKSDGKWRIVNGHWSFAREQ